MSKRRPLDIKHQSKISVQDVRDYSTPEGSSMAGEEMRRIALEIDQLKVIVPDIVKAEKADAPTVAKPQAVTPAERWALTIKHNGAVIPTPLNVQVINFADNDNITYSITPESAGSYKTVGRGVGIKVQPKVTIPVPPVPPGLPTDYGTLWEYEEHDTHTYSTGAVEICPTLNDIVNREPQYLGTDLVTGYPHPNNGDGWIPVKANVEVVEDSLEFISHTVRFYGNPDYPLSKNMLTFSPTVSGRYRINVGIFIKGVFSELQSPIAPKPRWYDSMDKGMLIAEKLTAAQFTAYNGQKWNPMKYSDGIDWIDNPSLLKILDCTGQHGDKDYTGDYSKLTIDGISLTGLIESFYVIIPPASASESGTPFGATRSNEMYLNGVYDDYVEAGEVIVFWYKLYGHRLKADSSNKYVIEVPTARSINLDIPPPIPPLLDPPAPNSSIPMLRIENRYEKVGIEYMGKIPEKANLTNVDCRNLITKF